MRFSGRTLCIAIIGTALLLPIDGWAQAPHDHAQTSTKDTENVASALLQVKRIFVDSFGNDVAAKQIQAMLINSLSETKRIIVTENRAKADAVLEGSTLESTSQELHSSSELTFARGAAVGDSSKATETLHRARIAVRLVAADGDVIWTSTQESNGGKYKGASADVADRVVKQLMHDLDKEEGQAGGSALKPSRP